MTPREREDIFFVCKTTSKHVRRQKSLVYTISVTLSSNEVKLNLLPFSLHTSAELKNKTRSAKKKLRGDLWTCDSS